MKRFKLISVAITFIIAFLGAYSISSADVVEINIGETDPCTELYPDTDWIGPNTLTMTIGDNCQYIIEYYYRTTSDGVRNELQIVGIYKIYGDDCPASSAEITKNAYARILDVDDMGWGQPDKQYLANEHPCSEVDVSDDPNGPNPTVYNLVVPSGMLDTTELLPGVNYTVNPDNSLEFSAIDYWIHCQDDVCCWMYYHLTWDGTDLVKMEWYDVGGGGEQPECEEPVRCQASCSNLKFNWYAPGWEPDPDPFAGVKESEFGSKNSSIAPNPNEGSFNLKYNSDYLGELRLKIFDSRGEVLYNKSIIKKSKAMETSLRLINLSDGIYFYNIEINGRIDSKGSFVIHK